MARKALPLQLTQANMRRMAKARVKLPVRTKGTRSQYLKEMLNHYGISVGTPGRRITENDTLEAYQRLYDLSGEHPADAWDSYQRGQKQRPAVDRKAAA